MQLGGNIYPASYVPQAEEGWLSKYEDGGSMQEHQENYNDSSVSMGPGFVGMGNNTKGRNYSPAWGGQFQNGGNLWNTNKKAYVDSSLNANKDIEWVKRLYESNPKAVMVPGETEPSTHLIGDNGQGYVFPSIVNMNGQLVDLGDGAEDYARKTNTGIQFPKEQGTWFARSTGDDSGYKMGTGVLKGKPVMQKYKSIDKKAMGGSMPGSVGFTYARTQGIPSKGPRRNQTDVTDASAQNGGEMSFYQNGLDWTPKNISRDGAWLDNYDVPQAQDGTYVKKPRTDMLTMDEYRLKKALANQPVIQTPKGKQLTREQVLAKNQQYAEEQGKVFNPETGSVSNFLSPSTARTFDRANENIVEPMIDIEMAMSAAPLVGKGLKSAGKFITKEVDKKNIIGNIINKSITPIGYDPFTVAAAPLELMTPESLKFKPSTYATKNRFDSWRLYNGLEPEFNTFSKNPDGTLALNSFRLEKDKLQKIVNNPKKSFGTTEIEKEFNFGGVHGNSWITKGVDEQGRNFIDFTDTWDLQPLKGVKGLPKKVREFEVSSLTGGKPFDLKNRIYYDDAKNFYNSDGSKLIEEVHHFPTGVVKQNEPASSKMLSTPDIVGQKQMDVLRDWDKANNSKFMKGTATLAGGVGSGIGYSINKEKQKLEKTKSSKQKKEGGEITKDDMGYWNPDNWGEPVEIGSNDITMDGVYEPLLGVSDTGDTQMMYPGEDYKFKGKKVTEYPVKKNWLEKYK
jgi:hypothetical protein